MYPFTMRNPRGLHTIIPKIMSPRRYLNACLLRVFGGDARSQRTFVDTLVIVSNTVWRILLCIKSPDPMSARLGCKAFT